MHCKGKLKLRSLKTSYCLIEVVTKTGLTNNLAKSMCQIANFYGYLASKYSALDI